MHLVTTVSGSPGFLILPWIDILNLDSHIPFLVHRRLPDDWAQRYTVTPVLMQTLVKTPRFTGVLYTCARCG